MSPQLDYNDMVAAVQGGLADAAYNDIASGVSAAIIQFGVGLSISAAGLVLVPAATGFQFAGVSIMKQKAQDNTSAKSQYEIGQAVPYLRKGRIYVNAEVAVNPTLAVFMRHTANTGPNPGDFLVTADTATADDISAFAKWVSVTSAAGLAILEINFP